MSDLERADALLYALLLEDAQKQEVMLANALALARREGAAEMRERAARVLDADAPWAAQIIRGLPLTPEEPINAPTSPLCTRAPRL